MNASSPKPETPKKLEDRGLKKPMVCRGFFGFRCSAGLVVALWAPSVLLLKAADAPTPSEVFRMGVSYASFGTVSRNDANAALKAWAAAVTKDHNVKVSVEVKVYDRECPRGND